MCIRDRTTQDQSSTEKAFSEVVLVDSNPSDNGVVFNISALYEPILFDNQYTSEELGIVVPEITTTRSTTERPASLFEQAPQEEAN